MPNPFRVEKIFDAYPGLSLRSNPGLKLANAFGVYFRTALLKVMDQSPIRVMRKLPVATTY
jgi:hypothetical protein